MICVVIFVILFLVCLGLYIFILKEKEDFMKLIYVFVVLFFIGILFGIFFVNKVIFYVFGMLFIFVYIVMWVFLIFVLMVIVYVFDKENKKEEVEWM